MRLKHNKKRNTAFLYEVLVRHITKSVLEGDGKKKKIAIEIIKEHFRKGTLLRKELDAYRAVLDKQGLDRILAEKLLYEAKRTYLGINKKKLFNEQSKLIDKINKLISKDAYSIFVPNYKSLASIQQIFNEKGPIKSRVLLESKIIDNIISDEMTDESSMPTVDKIVFKKFVKRFNEEYGDKLLEEQKALFSKYITSFSDNGLELKIFMNEEVQRLAKKVDELLSDPEMIVNEDLHQNLKKVGNIIKEFKAQKVDDGMVHQVLNIQSLIKEIQE